MRNRFARELELIMKNNKETFILTGDLGFSVLDNLKREFPERYIDIGLSEQSMLGVAAGMAITGKNVFVYSIIPFLIYRPFEQLRDDICFQNIPVRLVGVGTGFSYSDAGFTHHSIEDYGILMGLPNLTILSPSDPLEVSVLMENINEIKGPVYLRLAKNGEPILHSKHDRIRIGRALRIQEGQEVLIISSGAILHIAIEVSKILESKGISTEILNYHTIKPFDRNALIESSRHKKIIVTIEEHKITTGLYPIVLQIFNENDIEIEVIPFGINDAHKDFSGSREFLLNSHGLNVSDMSQLILGRLK